VLGDADRDRLEQAYRSIGPKLWRAVLAYAGGAREVADDAVAEAFAQAGRRLPSIRHLERWVFSAAFRIAAGELKRRRQWGELAEVASPADLGSQELTELMLLVRQLGPTQRSVFILRDVLGYTSRETAYLLGRTDGAVRVHLLAARRRLKTQLKEVDAHGG